MRRVLIFWFVASFCATSFSQNIEFFSAEFEFAIRDQLGLDEKKSITREMTNKITVLDISGYEIEDIRDIIYFPKLQKLDLSYNRLENISPLITLDDLRFLDISGNRLKSIDILVFSESSEMIVNVNGNYITDYSLIRNSPYCFFTIVGLNNQKSPYRINRFYTDFDPNTSQKIINYNVWSYSNYDSIYIMYDGKMELITKFNDDIQITGNILDNVVYLNYNDQNIDSVYFIFPKNLEVKVGNTIITQSFPAEYNILSAEASRSDVTISANAFSYIIVEDGITDVVKISFGNDVDIKGYTYYYINSIPTGIEYISERKQLLFYPNPVDNILTVVMPNTDLGNTTVTLVSLTGQIVYKAITNEALHHLNVQHLEKGIYILQVTTEKDIYIEKIIKK